jgi:hypothetical protein
VRPVEAQIRGAERSILVPQTVLSPIALTVRDQVLPAVHVSDTARIERVCIELLEFNTRGLDPASAELRSCVAAVVEGVLAALGSSRSNVLEVTMHAVSRFASKQAGADPSLVAAIICDAATVIEVQGQAHQSDLDAAIQGALGACDRLLGEDRDDVVAFLRTTLAEFFRKKSAPTLNNQTQRESDES